MTPNELTTIIASKLGRELDLAFRFQLFDEAKLWWARLVANTLERNPAMRVHFSSSITVPMEYRKGYSISTGVIPKPLELSTLYFDYVGSEDGRKPFTFAPAGTAMYLTANPYAVNDVTFDIVNQRLVIDKEGYCEVLVRAVFENPMEVELCKDSGCDPWNKPSDDAEDITANS